MHTSEVPLDPKAVLVDPSQDRIERYSALTVVVQSASIEELQQLMEQMGQEYAEVKGPWQESPQMLFIETLIDGICGAMQRSRSGL